MQISSASCYRRGVRLADLRAGFTLLEMLLAIAVMGLVMAITLPNMPNTLASNADRRAAFHFKRLALDLRATAYEEEQALVVVDSGQFQEDSDADPKPAEIKLDDGWSYSLSAPLNISARGLCDVVEATLSFEGRPHVQMFGATDCSFTWQRVPR